MQPYAAFECMSGASPCRLDHCLQPSGVLTAHCCHQQEREKQLQAQCADLDALKALMDEGGMAIPDLDRATFTLTRADLARLQQVMADAHAVRQQGVERLKDGLAAGLSSRLASFCTSVRL